MSRHRAAVWVLFGYGLALLVFQALFAFLEFYHKYDDDRDTQMLAFVAVVLGLVCARSLYLIYRRPGLDVERILLADSER